jgi:hypothetical protein
MVTFEETAALAPDRFGAEGGEFAPPVRLVERTVRNPEPAQAVDALPKPALVRHGADDQVGMREVSGEKRFANLDGGVAGLDDLLRNREVVPYEEIDIGGAVLGEFHGGLLG